MTFPKPGERIALAMRRGVVKRVSEYGFWIQLDGKPEDHQTWVGNEESWLEESMEPHEPKTLLERVVQAINRTSSEKGSNTPDFILAEYLVDCLGAFDRAVNHRAEWYGRKDHPGSGGGGYEYVPQMHVLVPEQSAEDQVREAAAKTEAHETALVRKDGTVWVAIAPAWWDFAMKKSDDK